MQALVVGGSNGYCFIEKDASLNSRAGSKAPRKGSLVNPSLLMRQQRAVQGLLPFLICPSHWVCEGIVWVGGEKRCALHQEHGCQVHSVSKHVLLVSSSPPGSLSDTGRADVTHGLKMLKV